MIDTYDPVDPRVNIFREFDSRPAVPALQLQGFQGAGVYALYYKGNFPLYIPVAEENQKSLSQPIYVGKALPPGSRKGGIYGADPQQALFDRMLEHQKSIQQTTNLNITDFWWRWLALHPIWIGPAEAWLIDRFLPLWNLHVEGFGNHVVGKNRESQRLSDWDLLHPGRVGTPTEERSAEMVQQGVILALQESVADMLGPPSETVRAPFRQPQPQEECFLFDLLGEETG